MTKLHPISARIDAQMTALGLSNSALAGLLNVSRQAVGTWRSGTNLPDTKRFSEIARVLECDPIWLLVGDEGTGAQSHVVGPMLSQGIISIENEDFISLPRFDARLSAGAGCLLEEEPEPLDYQLFERNWLHGLTRAAHDNLCIVQVDGDSMEPTLRDGDWVLIDTDQHSLEREGIFALRIETTVWIKRISLNLRERLIQIISDNQFYPMKEIEENEIQTLGRALAVVARKL